MSEREKWAGRVALSAIGILDKYVNQYGDNWPQIARKIAEEHAAFLVSKQMEIGEGDLQEFINEQKLENEENR